MARLHGSWTRGIHALARGEDELADFLLERIQAQGGTCRLTERATRLSIGRGGAPGVIVDGEAAPIGASFLVTDMPGEQLAQLAQGEGVLKSAERDWPRVQPAFGRFVLSVVVRSEGLPERLAREAFIGPKDRERGLLLHVVRIDLSSKWTRCPEAKGEVVLAVRTLLPVQKKSGAATAGARERVLEGLRQAFPFFERHLVLVDSPHDGRPVWVYDPERRDVERIPPEWRLGGGCAMAMQWAFERMGSGPRRGAGARPRRPHDAGGGARCCRRSVRRGRSWRRGARCMSLRAPTVRRRGFVAPCGAKWRLADTHRLK